MTLIGDEKPFGEVEGLGFVLAFGGGAMFILQLGDEGFWRWEVDELICNFPFDIERSTSFFDLLMPADDD